MSTQSEKPNRRWLRLSLKTLLVLLTAGCVLLATLGRLAYRGNQQRQAVQWVKKSGGMVIHEHVQTWMRKYVGIDYFANVTVVHINKKKCQRCDPTWQAEEPGSIGPLQHASQRCGTISRVKESRILATRQHASQRCDTAG